MADPYAAFSTRSDAADPYSSFSSPVKTGKTKEDLKRENPAEYDPASPEYQKKYGTNRKGPNLPAAVPEALLQGASAFGGMIASGWSGLGALATNALGITNTPAGDRVRDVQSAITYQPRTAEGQRASDVATYIPRKIGEFADRGGDYVAATPMLPSPYIPAEYQGTGAGPGAATIGNMLVQGAPSAIVGGILSGRGTANPSRAVAPGKVAPKAPDASRPAGLGSVPPTIEELGAQSKAAYKKASDAGVTITPSSFQSLQNRVGTTLAKEGIDPTLHPQTTAAFKRITETKGAVTLDQLETLRKIANDARGGSKPDARMAGKIVDELDDYTANIGRKDITTGDPAGFAALKEARSLYSRKAKAEEVSRLVKRAEISAPNFSASGFENALRTEFRALAKNDKKMRRFTPEEQAAIKKVAMGGKAENALRMIGKMAPTGVVSGSLGVMATAATGGLAAVLPAAGIAGRYAATRMTKANALKAEEVMRRGPPPKAKTETAKPKIKPKIRPKNALLELTP